MKKKTENDIRKNLIDVFDKYKEPNEKSFPIVKQDEFKKNGIKYFISTVELKMEVELGIRSQKNRFETMVFVNNETDLRYLYRTEKNEDALKYHATLLMKLKNNNE